MSFLSFKMTDLDQNIFDTVILEHPVLPSSGQTLALAEPEAIFTLKLIEWIIKYTWMHSKLFFHLAGCNIIKCMQND